MDSKKCIHPQRNSPEGKDDDDSDEESSDDGTKTNIDKIVQELKQEREKRCQLEAQIIKLQATNNTQKRIFEAREASLKLQTDTLEKMLHEIPPRTPEVANPEQDTNCNQEAVKKSRRKLEKERQKGEETRKNLEEKKLECDELYSQVKDLTEKLQNAESQIGDQKDEINKIQQQMRQDISESQLKNDEINKARQNLEKASEGKERTRKDLLESQTKCDELSSRVTDLTQKLLNSEKQKNKQNEELNKVQEDFQKVSEEREEMRKSLKMSQSKCNKLSSKVRKLSQKLDRVKRESRQKKTTLGKDQQNLQKSPKEASRHNSTSQLESVELSSKVIITPQDKLHGTKRKTSDQNEEPDEFQQQGVHGVIEVKSGACKSNSDSRLERGEPTRNTKISGKKLEKVEEKMKCDQHYKFVKDQEGIQNIRKKTPREQSTTSEPRKEKAVEFKTLVLASRNSQVQHITPEKESSNEVEFLGGEDAQNMDSTDAFMEECTLHGEKSHTQRGNDLQKQRGKDASLHGVLPNANLVSDINQENISTSLNESYSEKDTPDPNQPVFFKKDLFELFMGLNEKFRSSLEAWEFLDIRDLVSCACVSKRIRDKLITSVVYSRCRDGKDYLVPFPGFPGLFSTPEDLKIGAGLFPHQLASLRAMHQMENSNTSFGSLRGGILGDAPGLGKTITMLALIASTAGCRPVTPHEFWDSSGIAEGWKIMRINPMAKAEILTAVKPIRTWIEANMEHQGKECRKKFKDMLKYISPPFKDDRFPTIRDLELYVYKQVKKIGVVPCAELELFRNNMTEMKAGLDKSNRKLIKSSTGQRLLKERGLIPSSGTLIIVPDALLEHWFQQIHNHLNLDHFADKNVPGLRNIVYIDGIGDFVDVRLPLQKISHVTELPRAYLLSQYFIVITTFSRCETEFSNQVRWAHGRARAGQWKRTWDERNWKESNEKKKRKTARQQGGSWAQAEHQQKQARVAFNAKYGLTKTGVMGEKQHFLQLFNEPFQPEDPSKHLSPFLQIRWLRVVVDEGHELGTHEAPTYTTQFIHEVAAERRWVLSGTPTTGNEDSKEFSSCALDQLKRLLVFLRHPRYGNLSSDISSHYNSDDSSDSGEDTNNIELGDCYEHRIVRDGENNRGDKWNKEVKVPFLNREKHGLKKLQRVLEKCLVIHQKEDLKLPKPKFCHAAVDLPIPEEVQEEMQENIDDAKKILGEYLYDDSYQLLVDEAQANHIIGAIQKAKNGLASRGGGKNDNVFETASGNDDEDFSDDQRPIKAVVYSYSTKNLISVTEFLFKGLDKENIAELYDPTDINILGSEMSRFRNNFKEVQICPICHRENDTSLFKKREAHRCKQKLVEIALEETSEAGNLARFLIEPERILKVLQSANNTESLPYRMEGELMTTYWCHERFWRPGDIIEVDIRGDHPTLPKRWDEDQWIEYGADECEFLAEEDQWYFGPLPSKNNHSRDTSAIKAKLVKWQPCWKFHSKWYKGPTLCDSEIKRKEEDVCVLSLNAQLGHGLDLSFVTHIFLLDPIEDAALLEQVTSRAHRMGAKGPVTVETVNVFYTLTKETEVLLEINAIKKGKKSPKEIRLEEKHLALTTGWCQYCYRIFDTLDEAEGHEKYRCPRNPLLFSKMDHFHLSTVYKEIKPPPAVCTEVDIS